MTEFPFMSSSVILFYMIRYLEQPPWKLQDMDSILDACPSHTAKLKAVKNQIRIFKIGWELEDADVAFSSTADPYIGTLEHLTAALKTILTAVDKKKLKPPDLETITVSPSPISSLPPFETLTVDVAKRREMNRWTK